MTKLTDAQAALLRAASITDDGAAGTTDIAKPTIWSLIKRSYITPTEDPGRVTITDAGRAAIAEPDSEPPEADLTESGATADDANAAPPPAAVTPKGKIGLLLGLLGQGGSATIETMMTATGWQAHSVRGAISGSIKKALGYKVLSTKTDGARVYRLVVEEGA